MAADADGSPLTDAVARQYERFPYPAPQGDIDGPADAAARRRAFERALFWPEGAPATPRILVAGCGTEQAARCALRHRDATVLGIDVSAASLAHAGRLKARHGLSNLELRQLPIERAGELGREFDLIFATGVLHHMADPQAGMNALAAVLAPGGAINAMVYAEVGRFGINLARELFRLVGTAPDAAGIGFVRETLPLLHDAHPVRRVVDGLRANDFVSDSETVDMFLHARERSFTVSGCLALAAAAGLRIGGWVDNYMYWPDAAFPADSAVFRAIDALPDEDVWRAMETVFTGNWMHDFVAARRPVRPDFARTDLVPVMEWTFALSDDGASFTRWRQRFGLSPEQVAVIRAIDGARTVAGVAAASGVPPAFASNCIRSLWRLGCLALGAGRR